MSSAHKAANLINVETHKASNEEIAALQFGCVQREEEFQVEKLPDKYYENLHQHLQVDPGDDNVELLRARLIEIDKKDKLIKSMQDDFMNEKRETVSATTKMVKVLIQHVNCNLLAMKLHLCNMLDIYTGKQEEVEIAQSSIEIGWVSVAARKKQQQQTLRGSASAKKEEIDTMFKYILDEIGIRWSIAKTKYTLHNGQTSSEYRQLWEDQHSTIEKLTSELSNSRRQLALSESRSSSLQAQVDSLKADMHRTRKHYFTELLLKNDRIRELDTKLSSLLGPGHVIKSIPKIAHFGDDEDEDDPSEAEPEEEDQEKALISRLNEELELGRRQVIEKTRQATMMATDIKKYRSQIEELKIELERKWSLEDIETYESSEASEPISQPEEQSFQHDCSSDASIGSEQFQSDSLSVLGSDVPVDGTFVEIALQEMILLGTIRTLCLKKKLKDPIDTTNILHIEITKQCPAVLIDSSEQDIKNSFQSNGSISDKAVERHSVLHSRAASLFPVRKSVSILEQISTESYHTLEQELQESHENCQRYEILNDFFEDFTDLYQECSRELLAIHPLQTTTESTKDSSQELTIIDNEEISNLQEKIKTLEKIISEKNDAINELERRFQEEASDQLVQLSERLSSSEEQILQQEILISEYKHLNNVLRNQFVAASKQDSIAITNSSTVENSKQSADQHLEENKRLRRSIEHLKLVLEDGRSNLRLLREAQCSLIADFRVYKEDHRNCFNEDISVDESLNQSLWGIRGAAGETTQDILRRIVIDDILVKNQTKQDVAPLESLLLDAISSGQLPASYLLHFLTDEQLSTLNEEAEEFHRNSQKIDSHAADGNSSSETIAMLMSLTDQTDNKSHPTEEGNRSNNSPEASIFGHPFSPIMNTRVDNNNPIIESKTPQTPQTTQTPQTKNTIIPVVENNNNITDNTEPELLSNTHQNECKSQDDIVVSDSKQTDRLVTVIQKHDDDDDDDNKKIEKQTIIHTKEDNSIKRHNPTNDRNVKRQTEKELISKPLELENISTVASVLTTSKRNEAEPVKVNNTTPNQVIDSVSMTKTIAMTTTTTTTTTTQVSESIPHPVTTSFISGVLSMHFTEVLSQYPEFTEMIIRLPEHSASSVREQWLGPNLSSDALRLTVTTCFNEIARSRRRDKDIREAALRQSNILRKSVFARVNVREKLLAGRAVPKILREYQKRKSLLENSNVMQPPATERIDVEAVTDTVAVPLPSLNLKKQGPHPYELPPCIDMDICNEKKERLINLLNTEFPGYNTAFEYLDLIELVGLIKVEVTDLVNMQIEINRFKSELASHPTNNEQKEYKKLCADRNVLVEKFKIYRKIEAYASMTLFKLRRRKENILRSREEQLSKVLRTVGHLSKTRPKEVRSLLNISKESSRSSLEPPIIYCESPILSRVRRNDSPKVKKIPRVRTAPPGPTQEWAIKKEVFRKVEIKKTLEAVSVPMPLSKAAVRQRPASAIPFKAMLASGS